MERIKFAEHVARTEETKISKKVYLEKFNERNQVDRNKM
jgi:hypothetical protein